ncbi:MAG: hypothetical protein DRG78_07185 [Epsilonproteobacteria bacterium]|nr:MAG: hypothetical protein DRG78_07185 [Campylobacterota bacterium]
MFKNNKIINFSILTIVIMLTFLLYFEFTVISRYFNQNIQDKQKIITKIYNQKIKEVEHLYTKKIENILSVSTIRDGIKVHNIELLKKDFISEFKKMQNENKFVKTMLITDTNNIVLLRAHKPTMYHDNLTNIRPIIKKANETKKILYGFEAGKMSIPYRITVPVILDGVHYGVIDLGISSNYFIEHINNIIPDVHVTSLLNKDHLKKFIKSTYLNKTPIKKGFLAPNFNKFFEPFFDKIDLNKDISQIIVGNKTYLINTTLKIMSFDKTDFGTILISFDVTKSVDNEQKKILEILFIIGIILIVTYVVLRYKNSLNAKNKLDSITDTYKKQLELSAKTSGIAFWEYNFNTNSFVFNDFYYQFLHTTADEEDGYEMDAQTYLTSFIPQEYQQTVIDVIQEAYKRDKNYSSKFEYKMKRRDGVILDVLVNYTMLYDKDGQPIKSYGTKLDLTEIKKSEGILKKAKEEAENANIAKSEFLANMSHEIRTPLNAIMGFIGLLKEDEKNEEKIKYLKTIDTSSYNLLEIINDILDFSKIESNLIELEYIDYNPLDEFESIVELFRARVLEKNITFKVDIDKNLPYHINSDPLRIKQVAINLLSNAVKFTSQGKTIELKVVFKDNFLSVYVKDKGIGIAQNKLQDIFKPFMQADNSTTREYGGTGLGLTISSKLIKALGGELKVKSELGKGSKFYFTIPVKTVEAKEKVNKIDDFKELSGHILLVEDNKANQMFMKVILKKMGLTFDIANNGLEALERFSKFTCDNKTKYDAILMDENMPNMNGAEATKRILEIEKEHNLPHTPIIALTANALKGDRERFLDAGMDEYLTKPVNKKKLAEILAKFLGDIA